MSMELGPVQGGEPVNRVASSGSSSAYEKLDQINSQLNEIQKQLMHTKFYGANPGELDAIESRLTKLTSAIGDVLAEIKASSKPMGMGEMAQIQFAMNNLENLHNELAEQRLQPLKDMINKIKA